MKRASSLATCIVLEMAAMLTVLAVLAVYVPWALAVEEVHVPDDYSTIQAAIDAASDGDVIIVHQGIYYENIHFGGKPITVKGMDPNDQDVVAATIIDGNQVDSVVTFEDVENKEENDSVLRGITIQNGSAELGGGIYCGRFRSPTITNCTISNNSACYAVAEFVVPSNLLPL